MNKKNEVQIDVSLIPPHIGRQLGAATIAAIRRVQREDPELWAKIEARAAEIREGRSPEYNVKKGTGHQEDA